MKMDFSGKRVAVYTRTNQGRSVARRQRERCRKFVLARGGSVPRANWFEDFAGGSARANHPRLNRMMEVVEKGELDLVVVEGIDRLSRNLIEVLGLLAELRRKGVALVSTNDDGSRRSGILDVLGLTKNC